MSDLARISQCARNLIAANSLVEQATAKLNEAKALKRQIEENDLPELMREVGMSEFSLEDGTRIIIREEFECAISEARREAAHAWLRANGFGGLIKTEVTVAFGRDEDAAARDAAQLMARELGRTATVEERVHPQTLKSFVRERAEAGQLPPQELFGIRPFSRARVGS